MKRLWSILIVLIFSLSQVYSYPAYLTVPVDVAQSSPDSSSDLKMMGVYAILNGVFNAVETWKANSELKPGIQVYENPDNPNTAIVEIYGKDGSSFTYTTNGTKATAASLPYTGPLEVPLGTEINIHSESKTGGNAANSSFTICRSKPVYPILIDSPDSGSGIAFETEGTVVYFIVYEDEPVELSTYEYSAEDSAYLKDQPLWTEYTEPLYFSDLDCDYFTIYYTFFSSEKYDRELSSLVYSTSYHIYKGAAFSYVFYDKGYYSEGWRYLEACPFALGKTKWGADNTFTGLTTGNIGAGYENTEKLYRYIGNADLTMQSTVYAAKSAFFSIYGGKDDWYIPSRDEMEILHDSCSFLFSYFTDYWTSTEKDKGTAYTYRGSARKTKELKSLLIRRF